MGSGHAQADRIEPGLERALALQGVEAAEHDEKDFLANVVEVGKPEPEAAQSAANEPAVAREHVRENEFWPLRRRRRFPHAPESPLDCQDGQVCVGGSPTGQSTG